MASAGVQNQTLELVENRLKEAEVQLRKERDALGATQVCSATVPLASYCQKRIQISPHGHLQST